MRIRTADISTRVLGDETIVLNLANSRYFAATGVGTRILDLLSEDTSLEELVTTITSEYFVEPADAHRDVAAFVDRLWAAELLT